MNKLIRLILITISIFISIDNVSAAYITSDIINNQIKTTKYRIEINTLEGKFNDTNMIYSNNSYALPEPSREGYTFSGYKDDNGNLYGKKIDNLALINNKVLSATWNKNHYNVNYYLNNQLLFQKSIGYKEKVEDVDIQYLLDKYHKFEGWNNYLEEMPASDINLYANVSECYCKLITGHGPSGNALGLKKIFNSMGYNSSIRNADSSNNEFLVETDYSLTLKEFEDVKDYLETNTNYTSYFPYPYLYWLGLDCNNGYKKNLTRSVGQIHFE